MHTMIVVRRTVAALLLLAGALLLTESIEPLSADAAVVRSGDKVSIMQDAVVPGDFYVIGGEVNVSGTVEGDIYVLGGTLTLNGAVKGDVLALGGTISVHGPISDDLRAVGGTVIIAEAVGGDIAVFGGSLTTLSTAKVAGEVLFYGGEATIGGEVKGVVHARAEALTIEGSVGSIDASLSGPLTVQSSARVLGDTNYASPTELQRAPDAVMTGQVMHREVTPVSRSFDAFLPIWFMLLFSALVAVLMFKDRLRAIIGVEHTKERLGVAILIGFGVAILVPLAVVLLCVSVLGMVLGAMLLFGYLLVVLASVVLMHIFVGAFLARYTVGEYRISWLFAILGVVLLQALLLVPYIGLLVFLGAFLVTFGLLCRHLYRYIFSKAH